MPPIIRQSGHVDLRGERLLHLKWILSCLDLNAVASIDAHWFVTLFGSPCSGAFGAANELASSKSCIFAYDPSTRTATFRRVSAMESGVALLGERE